MHTTRTVSRTVPPRRAALAVALAAAGALALTACQSSGTTNGNPTPAASALQSAASAAASAASSALAGVQGAIDAKGDIAVGSESTDPSGYATAVLTTTNHTSSTVDYDIAVSFKNPSGDLVDATAVTIDSVAPGTSRTATVRSHIPLSGTITVAVTGALRH